MKLSEVATPDAAGRCTICGRPMQVIECPGSWFIFCECQLRAASDEVNRLRALDRMAPMDIVLPMAYAAYCYGMKGGFA